MEKYYVPHTESGPLVVSINGHDLLLIGPSPEVFQGSVLFEKIPESDDDFSPELRIEEYDLQDFDFLEEDPLYGPLQIQGGDDGVPLPPEPFQVDELHLSLKAERFAQELAIRSSKGSSGMGIVFIPPHSSLDDLLDTLVSELPWCH